MFRRRFGLLAGVLVALTVALFLAAPGLAIRRAIVTELFGPKMVRTQALEKSGIELNLDRGVITHVNSTQLTLKEADGRVQAIPLASTTQVIRGRRRLPLTSLALKWHVLVTWPASGSAESVDVEKTPRFTKPNLALRRAIVAELFGPKMVRAVALEKNGMQWNLDRGVITQVSSTELTVREFDGRVQPIPISSTTQVIRLGQQLPETSLATKWHVLVTWPATGPAQSVDIEKIPNGKGRG
jgi:hypothetical protein